MQFFRDFWQRSSLFYWKIQTKLINLHMRLITPHSCIGCSSSEIPDEHRLCFIEKSKPNLKSLRMRRITPRSCSGCSSSEIPDKHRLCFNRKIQTKPLNSEIPDKCRLWFNWKIQTKLINLHACAAPRHTVASAAVLQRLLTNIVWFYWGTKPNLKISMHAPHHATQLHRLQFFRDSWQNVVFLLRNPNQTCKSPRMRRTTPHSCIGCNSSEIPDKCCLSTEEPKQTYESPRMRCTTPRSCIGCSSSEIPDIYRLCFIEKYKPNL